MTSSILRKLTAAFALTLGAVGLSYAQPPVTSTAPGSDPSAYRAKEILGAKINIQNNTAIGTVDDIVFSSAGDVEYLIVNNDGKFVTVPWAAITFNAAQKSAVVDLTPEQYKVIPTYSATTYPQFLTPTYRTEIYKTYGLTPGQFRKIERRTRP